jgi:hypothetical protein
LTKGFLLCLWKRSVVAFASGEDDERRTLGEEELEFRLGLTCVGIK